MNSKLTFTVAFLIAMLPICVVAQSIDQQDTETLNNLGNELLMKWDSVETYEEGIEISHQALKYFEASKNWEAIAIVKMHLANWYYQLSKYQHFEQNINELKKLLLTHSIPDSLANESKKIIVWDFELKEDYSKAEQMYKVIFDYDLKYNDKITTAITANNIAYLYSNYLHDPQRALEYSQKAIQLLNLSDVKNERTKANIYSNMGRLYREINKHKVAKNTFYKSLQIAAPLQKDGWKLMAQWWSYENLSAIHLEHDLLDSFLYYNQKALSVLEGDNMFFQDDYQTYHTIGKYHLMTGDSLQAIKYYKRGLERAKKQEDVFRPINAIVALAEVLSIHKHHKEALDSLQMGLNLLCPDFKENNIFANPPASSFVHTKSALHMIEARAKTFFSFFEINNDPAFLRASLNNYLLADEIIHLIRQDYASDVSKYILAETALPIYENGIQIAHLLYKSTQEDQYLEMAFRFAEQNKSVLLLESIKANTAIGFGHLPDSILMLEKQLKQETAFTNKMVYLEKKKDNIDQNLLKDLETERFTLNESYNDLIDKIENQYPNYFELKHQPSIASIQELQQNYLDDNSLMLEYFVGEKDIFLFAIQKKQKHLYKIEKPTNLSDSFNELRAIITQSPNGDLYQRNLDSYNNISHSLYQLLVEEALKNSNSKQLIIIPDDFLIYLPFETLTRQNSKAKDYRLSSQSYLLKDFDISYSFSASLLLNTKDLHYKAQNDFAGFAPSFKNSLVNNTSRNCSESELYSLHCSEQEITDILQLFDGKTFTKTEANKNNFESILDDYNIIHLATHACIDETNPNFNRIYFTNDYLSNYDLTNMNIHANLAVLSACNTNVGPLMKGDGVSSLSKGFILAGVPSIVTSLWSVDDCSTSELMVKFYESLKKGNNKSTALKEAKIAYLKSADPLFSHPYYWAPFMLSGQDGVITGKTTLDWKIISAACLILLFGLLYFGRRNRRE